MISDQQDRELWRINGDTSETEKVFDIGLAIAAPRSFVSLDGYMYFTGLTADDGYVVFRTDGDILETVVTLGQDRPTSLTAAGGRLFFRTDEAL